MDPDFKALAQAWVANDPRLAEMDDPELAERLQTRLAEALDRRRREVQSQLEPETGEVVFSVDRSRLDPETGLDLEALNEVAQTLAEVNRRRQ